MSRFAAPISRIRAGLQIHDHTQIAAKAVRRECEVIVRLLREAAMPDSKQLLIIAMDAGLNGHFSWTAGLTGS